jgi:hypothetical protein
VKVRVVLTWPWDEFWVGLYRDRRGHKLYIFPVPCIGICVWTRWQKPRKRKAEL